MLQTLNCPYCGTHLDIEVLPIGQLLDIKITKQQQILLNCLILNYPRLVSKDQLILELYSDRPDGGPLNTRRMLSVLLANLRKNIHPYGWSITKNRRGPGAYGRYALKPLMLNS